MTTAPAHAAPDTDDEERSLAAVKPPTVWSRLSVQPYLRYLIPVEVLVLAAAIAFHWSVLIAAVVAAVALLVAFVAFDQATSPVWFGRAVRYRWHRLRRRDGQSRDSEDPQDNRDRSEPFDVEVPGVGTVGLRWDGECLVSVVELFGTAHTPTVLMGSAGVSESVVPVPAIAGLVRQHGLVYEALDLVTSGRRVAGTDYARAYDAIVGDRPAMGQRSTMVVARLNPQRCAAALSWRASVELAAAAATERIRIAIEETGCRAVSLRAQELARSTTVLLHHQSPGTVEETWRGIAPTDGDYVNLYEVPAAAITNTTLSALWATRTRLTVVTVRLSPDGHGGVRAGALVRMHTEGPLAHPPLLNLLPVHGRARDAFFATTPLGRAALRYRMRTARKTPTELAALRMIPGADGQILGISGTGYPVTVPLSDRLSATTVKVFSADYVAVQIVGRAAATGDTVAIFTDRPQMWRPILHRGVVMLADASTSHSVSMIVDDLGDSTVSPPTTAGSTLLVLCRTLDERDADIAISQIDDRTIRFVTSRFESALGIRVSRAEPKFLQHLAPATR
ncbi:type VII secretion protein EccE [Tsukamurella sp. 8F]|uniref:type VII secretion protein EccE n=1 Tax=unclassified Tsukamurella TaxID=2633480 RepID=UPI0023BA02A4|nr:MULTISPECIES: type VII secretion protein EccE [unclassified Tsukamurella]MDF0531137.1 type VII secretion protein EccE [Tsukamurella sp. 8J]MDF0588383.1 type VII secretion protein EccE [Tsukamurella sp. 8F]